MLNLKTRFVCSGSYYIGKTQPTRLQAILGTCVGVTLCDTDAGLGGLLHLLLPEPRSSESNFLPEKYASNGLPLFIKDICEAGASRENLKACIAGGGHR
jgi:chemotaxis receptor (MCP) glutamine deamidase CheD